MQSPRVNLPNSHNGSSGLDSPDKTAGASTTLAQFSDKSLSEYAQRLTGPQPNNETTNNSEGLEDAPQHTKKEVLVEIANRILKVCGQLSDEDICGDKDRALSARLTALQSLVNQLADKSRKQEARPPKQRGTVGVVRTGRVAQSNFLLDHVDPTIVASFKSTLNTDNLQQALIRNRSCLTGKYAGVAGKIGSAVGGAGMLIAELADGPIVGIELRMTKQGAQWRAHIDPDASSNFAVTITVISLSEASNCFLAIRQQPRRQGTAEEPSSLDIPGTVGRYSFMPTPFGKLIRDKTPTFPDPTDSFKGNKPKGWTIEFLAKMFGSIAFTKAFESYFLEKQENGQALAHTDLLQLVQSGDLPKLIQDPYRSEEITGPWTRLSMSVDAKDGGFRGSSRPNT
jgi:hypothetical protein